MKKKDIKKVTYLSTISLILCGSILATSINKVNANTGGINDGITPNQETRARDLTFTHKSQEATNLLNNPEYKLNIDVTARQLKRDIVSYTYYNNDNKVLLEHTVQPNLEDTKFVNYKDTQVFQEHVSRVKVTLARHTGVVKKTIAFTFDKSGPTISGVEDVIIQQGEHFDPKVGVKAYDAKDGDLTQSIVYDSPINENTPPGQYIIKYAVADSDGNVTKVSRLVTIEKESNIEAPVLNVVNDKDTQVTGFG
uniref:immunoglobulin-like domain-containing protein n=1 Tax=Lactococcus petauri TaxID=1940789 RepID=UPI0018AC1E91